MATVEINYDEVIQHTAQATFFLIEKGKTEEDNIEVWLPAKLILEHDQENHTFTTYENIALDKGLI